MTTENYQVRDVADIVAAAVPGSRVIYEDGGGPDERCYRVDFSKAAERLPGFRPEWTVPDGVRQLVDAYDRYGMTQDDLSSPRFVRLRRIEELMGSGLLEPTLRWSTSAAMQAPTAARRRLACPSRPRCRSCGAGGLRNVPVAG